MCVRFVYVVLSCLFIVALWSPAGSGSWRLGSLVCGVFLCFWHFLMWSPGSGVVFECIDSRSLPSSLLCITRVQLHFILFVCFVSFFNLLLLLLLFLKSTTGDRFLSAK